MSRALLALLALPTTARAGDWTGTPDQQAAAAANTASLNAALAALVPGDTLVVPNHTYWMAGGVHAAGLHNVTLQLDGTLRFLPGRHGWPVQDCAAGGNPLQPARNGSCVKEAIYLANSSRLTLTSSGMGTLHGGGEAWWGYVPYLLHGEDRPRLLSLTNATDVLVERWRLEQSAYWTFTAFDVARLEVRHCAIDNRVNGDDKHSIANLGALNTDGFDVAGRDIHIHHSSVWNQDDCVTIQPLDARGHNAQCTENVLVEDVAASGLGLTVGAVHPTRGHNCVRNVTFRRATMHHTFKGIYVKSGNSTDALASAEISRLTFEDVVMDAPSQVPIWIGPAQEADSAGACSLLWPEAPFAKCPPPPTTIAWSDITLRRIAIVAPVQSPGLVLGNAQRPMRNVRFDNVTVTPADPSKRPWKGRFYHCEGVDGVASGGTAPVPPCFNVSLVEGQI